MKHGGMISRYTQHPADEIARMLKLPFCKGALSLRE
jgi:hypothetical protein